MPFGFHSQSDGITAAADERGQKKNPKTCHIDLSVNNKERDKVNFKIIIRYKETHYRNFSSITHIRNVVNMCNSNMSSPYISLD